MFTSNEKLFQKSLCALRNIQIFASYQMKCGAPYPSYPCFYGISSYSWNSHQQFFLLEVCSTSKIAIVDPKVL